MPLSVARVRHNLKTFDFDKLFIEELGWDRHAGALSVDVADRHFTLRTLAEKRGVQIFECAPDADGKIPDYATRRKIEKQVAKSAYEHLIIFVDEARTTQVWQWVLRQPGRPVAYREYPFHAGQQSGDSLIQKFEFINFPLNAEESLGLTGVISRLRDAFDRDRLTKRFYDQFKREHTAFLAFIEGITATADREWYASLMLNRLMFIYFIQQKCFLDNDPRYLQNRLQQIQSGRGKGKFLSFYRYFLRRLFHEGFAQQPGTRKPDLDTLLGHVPYLNGGLFEVHDLEDKNPDIDIPDDAFAKLFAFFDQWNWHLDERPLREGNEINPDVLGYIFEKYINQKQMGAYYTKEDITEYIGKSTIIPYLFDAARKKCAVAFEPGSALWRLLREDPDRYIYEPVRRGVIDAQGEVIPESALPDFVRKGMHDPNARMFERRYNLGEAELLDAEGNKLTLPTETWREYVNRRTRCLELRDKLANGEIHDINDLITWNLDIRQFAEDVIASCEGPELLRAFYQVIIMLTILDPTCGSGAFLFAALNILEPLYEACLDRMRAFVDDLERSGEKHRPEKFADFRRILAEVEKHPNLRHFMLKSIIVNNLYGVDIMEEAVEICKLRLFLKLVAQVEKSSQLEPLPDIDFNIRAGNTLVGYTSREEVREATEREKTGQGRLLLGDAGSALKRIEEEAEIVDRAFRKFHEMQTREGMEAREFATAKHELRSRLQKLSDELDRYLAKEYEVDPDKPKLYEKWRKSHQPFHWFAEFYGIMHKGGFDVIIGNPPYLDLRQLEDYTTMNYTTLPTKNLYSLVIERCVSLAKGRQGYIVPISSTATEGYVELQRILLRRQIWFVSFDDRPAHLFDGLDKNTLSILLLSRTRTQAEVTSSRLNRWSSDERLVLFPMLQLHETPSCQLPGCVPRIGSEIEFAIWQKLFSKQAPLAAAYSEFGKSTVFYSRKVNAFLQILDFVPEVRDGSGQLRPPSEFKELHFSEPSQAAAVFCLLNSTMFRWFIDTVSDGSHLNRREIDRFPFDPRQVSFEAEQFLRIADSLSANLKRNSFQRTMTYSHDTLTVQCIVPKHSKTILDEVDRALARYYGFTDEELDFIINYDIKYRMGREAGSEEEDER